MEFDRLVQQATGHGAYEYQRRVAAEGLPEVLRVPTGSGKTLAVILGWLFRRRFHPDPAVRASTPHWLVFVLPMRVLVEQVRDMAQDWLRQVAPEVAVQVLMGGEGVRDTQWLLSPEHDSVVVGTVDMLLSRALNRGYGESRFIWPVAFGLLNAGCAWVFDEVQLLGPSLPTSRQLDAFRESFGTAGPTTSTWMSATVDPSQLCTVDRGSVGATIELDAPDRDGPLATRLGASKVVRRLEVDDAHRARSLAEQLVRQHRSGTRTIAVMNTVKAAVELWREIRRRSETAETVLLHSRFRPPERQDHTVRALADVDPNGPGLIVVSTQVLEAGVDITSTTLYTEAAPWPSVVQRAGRCNRSGESEAAVVLWSEPAKPAPYEASDVEASAAALWGLEGREVTPEEMGERQVEMAQVIHPVLRRRDLLGLFDTAPDLSGNDLDVGRFIRAGNDLDAAVAWWDLDGAPPADRPLPGRDERCPVPVGDLRVYLRSREGGPAAWRYDHLGETWVRCRPQDVRPGSVIVLGAADGGYDPAVGWDPACRERVEELAQDDSPDPDRSDTSVSSDPASFVGEWITLRRHLEDVEREVRVLARLLEVTGLSGDCLEAAGVAGRLHDVGKAHAAFQEMLLGRAGDDEGRAERRDGGPWAKSDHRGGHYPPKHRHFRHELVSALALLGEGADALGDIIERDLAVYLVAAHHGRVRLGIRSLPEDGRPAVGLAALGVWDGDMLPEVDVPGATIPEQALRLQTMGIGLDLAGRRSWTDVALGLLGRDDLGPFRLAFLEVLVRVADWRASAGLSRDESARG